LAVAFSDATDLVLRGQYSRIEQLEYSGIPTAVARLPNVDTIQFTSAPDAPDTVVENTMLTAELTHRFSPNLTGTVRARYYESSFDEFASFPFLSFFPLAGTQAAIIRGQLPTDIEETTIDASLLWQGEALGLQHTLLFGATWDGVDYRVGSGFAFAPIGVIDYTVGPQGLSFGTIPAITGEQANEYRTLAFYVQDEIKVGDRLTVLLSGRYAEYELSEVAVGTATLTDQTYSEFDPRVGVSFRVNDGVSLFAGYATGSRLSLFFTGDLGQPPVPETSESIEAGVKFDTGSIGLSGTIAAFQITREDIPVLSFINPFASVQGGAQESQGVELDLVWEPSENLSMLGNLALTDAAITDDSNIPGASNVGNQRARVPETSGRIAARYRFTEGAFSGLGIGLGATYASEAPTTDENIGFGDDYLVFDAQASYDWDRFRIGLNIVNLTDEDYLVPYQYLAQDVVRPGQPLSAYVSLSARF
jgi:iron complex outermembrane recepter protein